MTQQEQAEQIAKLREFVFYANKVIEQQEKTIVSLITKLEEHREKNAQAREELRIEITQLRAKAEQAARFHGLISGAVVTVILEAILSVVKSKFGVP